MDSGRGRGKRGQGRGATRGKPRGRGRGRGRKAARIVSSEEETSMDASEVQEEASQPLVVEDTPPVIPVEPNTPTLIEEEKETKHTIDMEADISQLEAPTFTTIQRNIPEPMLRLNWNHKVNLLGEKVMNPLIHICDQCNKPVLIYGRMIPCKHVFCFKCAKSELLKACPRCKDKVMRVEQTALGTVFMCSHGGPRHGSSGCRRTYLSQRDLNAHINHRHVNLPESKLAILESKAIAQPLPHQNSQHQQRKDSLTSSHSNQLQQSTPSNRHVKHGSNAPSISVMQPTPRTNLANQATTQEQVQQSQGGYYSNNQQRPGSQGYNSGSFNGNQPASQGHSEHDHRPPAQNAPFYSSQYGQHNHNNNNSGHYTQQQQPQQNQQWNQSSGYYR